MRAAGDMQEGPPFGFLGKKIAASKAGPILPYYGGGDNARKNFVGGEILSHTMIFFNNEAKYSAHGTLTDGARGGRIGTYFSGGRSL